MVFLNGTFIEKSKASISVMDRGFLFGDGVYEVIPVYFGKIFRLTEHLDRLQKSLDSIKIPNPYAADKWRSILTELLTLSSAEDQSLYLQITRGSDTQRKHSYGELTPTVYIESNPLIPKLQSDLEKGFSAISQEDIRWSRCDIKATSLLSNILYAQQAKQHQVEEVILSRNDLITEGATSNVFMLKDGSLFTHPTGPNILSGITRDLVLISAKACHLDVQETPFTLADIHHADGLWISSSTREIMPITLLNGELINRGVVHSVWKCVYDHYQQLKI